MLCLAAKATPVGFVKIGDQPASCSDLARLTGETTEMVTSLVCELETRGVLSRNRQSTIYNRRMVRDEKRREINRKNGKIGGLASLGNRSGIFKSPKPLAEPLPTGPPSPTKPSKPTEPSEEGLSANADSSADRRRSLASEFEDWWRGYPHKVGKAAALIKFKIARRTAEFSDLVEGVQRYVERKPADRSWVNPARWLFEARWLDQPATEETKGLNGHDAVVSESRTPREPPPEVPPLTDEERRYLRYH